MLKLKTEKGYGQASGSSSPHAKAEPALSQEDLTQQLQALKLEIRSGIGLCRRLEEVQDFEFQQSQYRALRDPGQLFLLEVACSATSVLSAEAEAQGYRTQRCRLRNSCDLTTSAGVKQILKIIREEHPEHIWISTDCSAFSPMQT